MAASTRQANLFAAEDWKKVYETFREADFQSYDYETIRKSMVDYIRTYYPEDFNDFIENTYHDDSLGTLTLVSDDGETEH